MVSNSGAHGHAWWLAVRIAVSVAGRGFWWLKPRANTLPDGLWLAFTTAATLGYGEIVPSTPTPKIFSVLVVILGFGVLSLVTEAIATRCIDTELRSIYRRNSARRSSPNGCAALRCGLAAITQVLQHLTADSTALDRGAQTLNPSRTELPKQGDRI